MMRVVYDHDGDKAVINVMNLPPVPSFHEQRRGVSGTLAFPATQANGEDLETKIGALFYVTLAEKTVARALFGKKREEKSSEELK